MVIDRQILRLSLPAIASNVTVPLLGICDTAIAGHLGSPLFLAAIGVGSVMLNVVFWVFGFLRMGTTGLTANALGASDGKEIRRVFSRSFFLALIAGIILIALQAPLFELLLGLVKAEEEVGENVLTYFNIRIWGAPALLATMAMTGWLVGMQTTLLPMIISISMNIINILMSLLFVFVIQKGFAGIALGTMISNWAGMGIGIACCLKMSKGKKLFSKVREICSFEGIGKFFRVNSALFIRSLCIICVTLGLTAAGARLGAMALAVNVIVMQFFQFFSFFMDGFAFSGEALTGLYAGKKEGYMLSLTVKHLLMWTLSMGVAFSLIYFVGAEEICRWLSDSPEVADGVASLLVVIGLIPIISAWAFIYDGFYVGLADTKLMMIATIIASAVFFIITFPPFPDMYNSLGLNGNERIWTGFLFYLALRGIILAACWKKKVRGMRLEV